MRTSQATPEGADGGAGDTMTAPPASPQAATAVETADVLLAAAVQRRTLAVIVEPAARGHEVLIETPDGITHAVTLEPGMGDAVVARVALVVGLDVAAPAGQLGRVTVALEGATAELVAMTFNRGSGRGFEVRRLVGPGEAAPPPRPVREGALAPVSHDRVGAYRLMRKLGDGGMGAVYRAEHVALAKPVAIKILHPDVARDPRLSITLLREGRLASRAHHPGIVDVTDFGTTQDGRTYLVMELVEWPTLREVLHQGMMDGARAVAIARQILVALDQAHNQGVVHRDLKPANVFVGPSDAIKIGDFGTARALRPGESGVRDTRENTVSGSPDYMSPEHCRGQLTDRRTDIYAVGCILFELLTGSVPFSGETPVAVMLKQVHEPVPPVQGICGEAPDLLAAVVRRAMAKTVEARYQDAPQMIAELDRAWAALAGSSWGRRQG
jgi:tRNA A-37 threonylcarbamoyl transferase component Bud32